jgi:2-dehydro-3-deoxygalactonokinase
MRGEETQLLGLVALGHRDVRFVHPGTHGKWGELRDGCVARFSTYMTGELFGLLSRHGTLAAVLQQPVDDPSAFAAGVRASGQAALSHALFQVRARVVAGDMPAASARDLASGVLIGAEWHDALRRHGVLREPVRIFGDAGLVALHVRVAQQLAVPAVTVDAREVQLAAWAALLDPNPRSRSP